MHSDLCLKPSQGTTHTIHKTLSYHPGHKQSLGTPTSIPLHYRGATTPSGRLPLSWELSPQFIIFSVHEVRSSNVPLVPEHLGTLTPAPASSGTEGSPSPSPDPYSTTSSKSTEILFQTFANHVSLFQTLLEIISKTFLNYLQIIYIAKIFIKPSHHLAIPKQSKNQPKTTSK